MTIRKLLALSVVVPALAAGLAHPAAAESRDVVTFAGTFQLKPTPLPQTQTTSLCFFAVACPNDAEPGGMASGAGVDAAALQPHVVDGIQATATYVEVCAPGTAFQPQGFARLSGNVHRAAGAWSEDIDATWTRVGLVAVIQGEDAIGAALFTPVGPATCGVASPVAVTGVVELAN